MQVWVSKDNWKGEFGCFVDKWRGGAREREWPEQMGWEGGHTIHYGEGSYLFINNNDSSPIHKSCDRKSMVP